MIKTMNKFSSEGRLRGKRLELCEFWAINRSQWLAATPDEC